MGDLVTRHCTPKAAKVPAEKAEGLLGELPGFTRDASATRIFKTFEFKNYYETMAFVNALAFIAHREDHHPDLEVGYKTCKVTYSTHDVGGLSENDFICAAKVNALVSG